MTYSVQESHGIMFHHFHDSRHVKGQGSISQETFVKILDHVGSERLLPAQDWLGLALKGALDNQVCLTFDDALRCQIDVALPVMEARGLTAFWFINSSAVINRTDTLEVYRHFRSTVFPDIAEFADVFVRQAELIYPDLVDSARQTFDPENYLSQFSFYSVEDRWFRYLRDMVLGDARYRETMNSLMEANCYDGADYSDDLWMTVNDISRLHEEGHVIGLHSHNHPTQMEKLAVAEQFREYSTNSSMLQSLLGHQPQVASHPCNSYNAETLDVLEQLGIKIAFRSNLHHIPDRTSLELPRQDHAIVAKEISVENRGLY